MAEPAVALTRWAEAAETLHWDRRFDTVRSGSRPGTWFPGGRLNVAVNCLDRHLASKAGAVALHWEGEPGDRRDLTYGELHAQTVAFAAGLGGLGVVAGDRVALHLGLVPELVVAALACARLGAVVSTVPVSLPTEAMAERLKLLRPRVLVTQDGAWRHGVVVPLKSRADEALAATGTIEHVIVARRTGIDVSWYESDKWFDSVSSASPAAPPDAFPSEHPLYLDYLPAAAGLRGLVHGSAGLLVHAATLHRVLAPDPDDVLWCAWEAAWVAGMSHTVLGPLACGATSVIFEGMLDTPSRERLWEIIERYQVTTLVTTPTVVDRLRRWSTGISRKHEIRSLRRVVTAAEPLSTEDREWLVDLLGGVGGALHDGWGQNELGGIVALTPAPPVPPPDAGLDIVDAGGKAVAPGRIGELVLRRPWAGIFVRAEGDLEPGPSWSGAGEGELYHTWDRARREPDGMITVLGRLDPVVKVSGQMVCTAAVVEVLCQHPLVWDAEVMQVPSPDGGRLLVAWVVPVAGPLSGEELAAELRVDLHEMLGGLSVPHVVAFVEEFPPELSRDDRRRALLAFGTQQSFRVFNVQADQLRKTATDLGTEAAR